MALLGGSNFLRNANPVGAIDDFRTVFRQAGRNRWRFAALAAAATIAVFSVMVQEGAKGPPRPPKIIYITSFEPGRSDAQIAAENRENQKLNDAIRAEQAKRDEEVRQIYVKLGRMSGMDVDAIEARAKAEREAEEAARRGMQVSAAPSPAAK